MSFELLHQDAVEGLRDYCCSDAGSATHISAVHAIS
jgi:hypothetical protein